MMRRRLFCLMAAAMAVVLAGAFHPAAGAAGDYPLRPVRLIIPYPPGGAGDIVGRILAASLAEVLGQPMVTDNRGGGGQVIATQLAAGAQADGHTLFLSSATHAINPALRKNLPYDTLRDFAPITLVAQSPLVFVAHPSLGAGSIAELVAAAKARPGRINYASSGPGSGGHMSVELLKAGTGIDLVHIPYKGAGPALIDLVAGQVQVMCTSPLPAMPHVKAGRLRALAMTGLERSTVAPDIPAVAETIPGYQSTLWYALLAPAGTPARITSQLHAGTAKVLAAPGVRQKLLALGAEPVGNRPQELQAFLREEIGRWTALVRKAKISLDD